MRRFVVVLFCILVGSLMVSSAFAASQYLNNNSLQGDWSNTAEWFSGAVPLNSTPDELKLFGQTSGAAGDFMTVTVSTNVGNYNGGSKIETCRDSTLKVVAGGYIGNNKEIIIGKADASGNGSDNGYLNQTGGTVEMTAASPAAKLEIGYKALAVGTDGGIYTISGGTLTSATGRMYVGCSGGSGTGSGVKGKFKVVGNSATISLGGEMYVGNDSSTADNWTGTGTVEFALNLAGEVSKIQVLKSIIDSQNSAAAVANLLVDVTGVAPLHNILLIENTGTSAVVGDFDSLNGGSALEGATVVLGGYTYTLTYQYKAGVDQIANDIALVIPEPATIALLGLGLLAMRRNKK